MRLIVDMFLHDFSFITGYSFVNKNISNNFQKGTICSSYSFSLPPIENYKDNCIIISHYIPATIKGLTHFPSLSLNKNFS